MGWRTAWLVALVFPLGVGCRHQPPVQQTTLSQRPAIPPQSSDPDMVQLVLAVLERPLHDPFLNQGMWKEIDQAVVEPDRMAAVEDNGFRVGQVVGLPTADLQALLKSCPDARCRLLPTGKTATQALGNIFPRAHFEFCLGEQTAEESLDQAQFCLDVVPTIASSRIRLQFTPKVQYGEAGTSKNRWPIVQTGNHRTLALNLEKPCKTFSEMSWEVEVSPGDILVIGAWENHPRSLAWKAFTGPENAMQRILVLRAARFQPSEISPATLEEVGQSGNWPLLLLASYSAGPSREK